MFRIMQDRGSIYNLSVIVWKLAIKSVLSGMMIITAVADPAALCNLKNKGI
jgi:hypothetical protein